MAYDACRNQIPCPFPTFAFKTVNLKNFASISLTTLSVAAFVCNPSLPALALGVHNGVLAECVPPRLSCISSQDDAPASFLEPWQYDPERENIADVRARLLELILEEPGARLLESGPQYVRFVIDVPFFNGGGGVDDIELYFPDNDAIVHFRGEAHGSRFDLWRNRRRMNSLRVRAGLEAVPVLRGRSSVFRLFESPFDEFGPSAVDVDAIIRNGGVGSRPLRQ